MFDQIVGDSGGPLFVPAQLDGNVSAGKPTMDIIVGVTSFGPGDCTKPETPGVYASIGYFKKWINGVIFDQVLE